MISQPEQSPVPSCMKRCAYGPFITHESFVPIARFFRDNLQARLRYGTISFQTLSSRRKTDAPISYRHNCQRVDDAFAADWRKSEGKAWKKGKKEKRGRKVGRAMKKRPRRRWVRPTSKRRMHSCACCTYCTVNQS